MSAQLPDDKSGAARPPSRPYPLERMEPDRFLRRNLIRMAWRDDPVVRLRHVAHDDALIVDILPLPRAVDRVVDNLLCIEFDGDDIEALPTAMCLTGFTVHPDSSAAKCARHLLGDTLWRKATALVAHGADECEVRLDTSVRDSRLAIWRRLNGMAIGIEVQPGSLRAALVGADGELIAVHDRALSDMSPDTVTEQIAALIQAMRIEHHVAIAGSPLFVGVQVPGPVDPATGVVHYFYKRNRNGPSAWGWDDEPFQDLLDTAIDLPVRVINDVTGYATYEKWTNPTPEHRRVVVLISQGIGAKLLVDGRVETDMPMEIGNMVLHEDGRDCDCGGKGCLEASAGTMAIVEQISEMTGSYIADIAEAVAAADGDDEMAMAVFREAGRDLARVVGHVQAILNTSSWSIYGPEQLLNKDSAAGAVFLDNLFAFERFVAYKPYRDCELLRRPILGDEGAHGAGLVALEVNAVGRPG